jgi:hypothetical protein
LPRQNDTVISLLAGNTDESYHADATQSQLSGDTDESCREDANSYHISTSLHLQTTRNKGAKSTNDVHGIQDSCRPDSQFRPIPTCFRTDCSKFVQFCNKPKSSYICEGDIVENSSIVSFLRDIWPFDTLCINMATNICNYVVRWDVRDLAYFMYLHYKSVIFEPS